MEIHLIGLESKNMDSVLCKCLEMDGGMRADLYRQPLDEDVF